MQSAAAVPNRFFVAVDGSPAAHWGYLVTTRGLMKLNDLITVGHVYNKEKTYLSFEMQAEPIRQYYEADITGYGSRANMVWEELAKGVSTKEHVSKLVAESQSHLMVVGMHGRKGPKDQHTICGSAVQHLTINPVCPVLIVKDKKERGEKKGNAYRWCVCFDGSAKALKAFNLIVQMMDKTIDNVVFLTVKKGSLNVADIEKQAGELLKSNGIKGECVFLEFDMSTRISETICNYLMGCTEEENYIDFVAVGNQGADFGSKDDKNYLGSVCSGVINDTNLNVFFVA